MPRIFVTLAGLNAVALIASTVLGLMRFYSVADAAAPTTSTLPFTHFVVGLFTSILTLFVHCLIFTYFLGTGRWVKEVARAYQLDDAELPKRTREFKRQVFPPALFAMLSVIAAAASGAAVQTQAWPWWTHPVFAVVTLGVNGWAFVVEYRIVTANVRVLDQVMAEVKTAQESEAAASSPQS